MSEIMKYFLNRGDRPPVYFWRDKTGNEIDAIVDTPGAAIPVEIKSGATVLPDFFNGLDYWKRVSGSDTRGYVIYGGDDTQRRSGIDVLSWRNIDALLGRL